VTWDAIGAIGEIVGAAAVVVTLVFLTLQLRHSNQSQRSAAYQSYLSARSRFQESLLDSNVNQAFLTVSFAPAHASPEDLRNYHLAMHLCLTYFEAAFRLWREGLLSDEDWNSNLVMLGEFRGTPAFRFWWPAANPFFGSDFIEAVNNAPITETGLERFLKAVGSAAGASGDAER
jgi:hypothetical protein